MSLNPTPCAACGNPKHDTPKGTTLCQTCISCMLLNSRLIPRIGSVLPVEQRRLRPSDGAQAADSEGAQGSAPVAGHLAVVGQQVGPVKEGQGHGFEGGVSSEGCEAEGVESGETGAGELGVGREKEELGVQKVIGKKKGEWKVEKLLIKAEMRGRGRQKVRRFPLVMRERSYKGFHEVLQKRFGTEDKLLVEYQDRGGQFVPVAEDDAVVELYRLAQMYKSRVIRLRLGAK